MQTRTIVFDISTLPGVLGPVRPAYYACCYHVEHRRYEDFDPRQAPAMARLIKRITSATELVTFNGAFDLDVLETHYGSVALTAKHTDMHEVLNSVGRWMELDEAAWINLGERKLRATDLVHDPVNRSHVRRACRSDVRQTYKLWVLHQLGRLKCW